MTKQQEHLAWCKERALAYVEAGDPAQALASFFGDLLSRAETSTHPAIVLGASLMFQGLLSTPEQVAEYINGFE